MSFSARVHPAPFSPTPNRHAGIGLKMKGGGPGGSRLGQKSLASSIPGWRGARGAGLQKEVCSLTHPPSRRRRWWWRCVCLEGEKEGLGFSRGEMTSPQRSRRPPPFLSLLVSLALFVHIPSFHIPLFPARGVLIASIYSWCRCCFCAPFVGVSHMSLCAARSVALNF